MSKVERFSKKIEVLLDQLEKEINNREGAVDNNFTILDFSEEALDKIAVWRIRLQAAINRERYDEQELGNRGSSP